MTRPPAPAHTQHNVFEIRGDTLIVPSWEWTSAEPLLLGSPVRCKVWHDYFGFTFVLPNGMQVACAGAMDTDALPAVKVVGHVLPHTRPRTGHIDTTPDELLTMLAAWLREGAEDE